MSRSRKKKPIHSFCKANTQKWWKNQYNRRIRADESSTCRKIVNGDIEPDEAMFWVDPKEVSDVWVSPSDGKWLLDEPWYDDPHDYKRWMK